MGAGLVERSLDESFRAHGYGALAVDLGEYDSGFVQVALTDPVMPSVVGPSEKTADALMSGFFAARVQLLRGHPNSTACRPSAPRAARPRAASSSASRRASRPRPRWSADKLAHGVHPQPTEGGGGVVTNWLNQLIARSQRPAVHPRRGRPRRRVRRVAPRPPRRRQKARGLGEVVRAAVLRRPRRPRRGVGAAARADRRRLHRQPGPTRPRDAPGRPRGPRRRGGHPRAQPRPRARPAGRGLRRTVRHRPGES